MKRALLKILTMVFFISLVMPETLLNCMGLGKEFVIKNKLDFATFSSMVRAGDHFFGDTVVLKTDIDTTHFTPGILPIGGDKCHAFCGTFDGCCHSINLNLNVPDMPFAGLFSYVEGAKILNLNIFGTVRAKGKVGGFAGILSRSYIFNCNNYALISGEYEVGGIVGLCNGGNIHNCMNFGPIFGNSKVGSITGNNNMSGVLTGECRLIGCENRGIISKGS